jgi:bifunctional ADP-heptose synthase (sugar kinase/adenylyltransferase)
MKDKSRVLLTGVYNVLHAGHIQMFEWASQFGMITVGINGQEYTANKHGNLAVPVMNRTYCLQSNRFVDSVVVFNESNPATLIRQLRPKYFVKGPDYLGVDLPEAWACNKVGTQILIHRGDKIHDSSTLVNCLDARAFNPFDPLD